MSNKIIFHSKRKQNIGNKHFPQPSKNEIPQWFSSADKHKKLPNGMYQLFFTVDENGKPITQRVTSWKSCPAILDTMISGYTLKTPIDVRIERVDGHYRVGNIEECAYFCTVRGDQDGFPSIHGYEDYHFSWITNWMPQVPEGYTTLWVHPLNRFDLPFITISGFIDTESYHQRGRLPFVVKKDFEGIIPAGTPYAQIIPVKSENWEMDLKLYTEEEIDQNDDIDLKRYVPGSKPGSKEQYYDHGFLKGHISQGAPGKSNYKTEYWVKKQYD